MIETDESIEKNVPGFGPGGTPNDAEWYSFGNWFLWQFWKKDDRDIMTGVWRSEVFRDNNGIRTGFAANFYEMTVGFIIKPKPYIWIRPEARYDWCQGAQPVQRRHPQQPVHPRRSTRSCSTGRTAPNASSNPWQARRRSPGLSRFEPTSSAALPRVPRSQRSRTPRSAAQWSR